MSLSAQSVPQGKFPTLPDTTLHSDIPAIGDACASLQKQSEQFISLGSYSVAAGVLQKSLSVCSNRKEVLLELAKAQLLSQQTDAALASLHLLLADDPGNVQAFITQGQALYFDNKDSDAESSLMHAAHLAPKDAEPHYWLGRIYYMDFRLQEATAQFQEALKLNPDTYKAYDGLALCYENKGDISLTVKTYMDGIALVYKNHPHYDVIYADLAEFLLRYDDNQKAFTAAAEAVTRNPREPRNFFLAGKAAEQEAKYDVSIRWLTKAAEMDLTYPDPHYLLARIYKRIGNMKAAADESTKFQILSARAPQLRR
ncbi:MULTISPECIES: lipopolysaccharide assembly protein LapB [Acidobacteriaceae]|uniref:tetratricopeptide repeat protein n=1 Tax=Acidobacteriaceae TaxID=204434 RepID=UPI00131D6512|nr:MULTISPECIES: tetratricopeptide repeat protein [Acidobacteriaceae]MDW5264593.1 tetratricopeptide repeat protein [Edaphobacter sp.]